MYTARRTLLASKVLSNFGQSARIRPRPAGEAASSNRRRWNAPRPLPSDRHHRPAKTAIASIAGPAGIRGSTSTAMFFHT
jgi:hypothetical protein